MSKKTLITALVTSIFLFTSMSFAGEKKSKTTTVKGTLVDTKCYGMNNGNMSNDHNTPKGKMSKCAAACAKMGIPVGVLEKGKKGGTVHILITPAGQLADHMSKEVKVSGMKTAGGLIPKKIEVKENGWK